MLGGKDDKAGKGSKDSKNSKGGKGGKDVEDINLEPLQLEQEIHHSDIALQTRNRKTWKAFLHP